MNSKILWAADSLWANAASKSGLRRAGILLHPTSLPSAYGSGDFGYSAYAFVDFLAQAKQTYWQVLPLNPVAYGNSPYQSPAPFAGNPLLISLDLLIKDGLLINEECLLGKGLDSAEQIAKFRLSRLSAAYKRFKQQLPKADYEQFCQTEQSWLDDYALFMAIKQQLNYRPWYTWQTALAKRDSNTLAACRELLADSINYYKFLQYKFFRQWHELKKYANDKGIKLIGDMPIFIAHDSVDVWSRQNLFALTPEGKTEKIAGVPPDYFSKTGQLWGNPQYCWEKLRQDDYKWWRERFTTLLKLVDVIRVDHFRGFEAYWEIPGDAETAIEGKWVKGPGEDFFATLERYLGKIPIIAEDLGIITPAVTELKDKFAFPGMKVLHFALNLTADKALAFSCEENCVVYTGTHDNNTTVGWLKEDIDKAMYKALQELLAVHQADAKQLCWKMIELAYASAANTAIIPMQDLLALGSAARMNRPGTTVNNWRWQLAAEDLTEQLAEKIAYITDKYNRSYKPLRN